MSGRLGSRHDIMWLFQTALSSARTHATSSLAILASDTTYSDFFNHPCQMLVRMPSCDAEPSEVWDTDLCSAPTFAVFCVAEFVDCQCCIGWELSCSPQFSNIKGSMWYRSILNCMITSSYIYAKGFIFPDVVYFLPCRDCCMLVLCWVRADRFPTFYMLVL